MNKIFKFVIGSIVVGFLGVLLFYYVIFKLLMGVGHIAVDEARKSYNTPDTTIVVKNGVRDTTITKKSMPSILK